MDQALFTGRNLHKGAEIHKPGDLAVIERAGLRIVDNGVDNCDGALAVVEIQAGNIHMPILLDIHFDVALGADFLDNLAARANDLADFIHRNDDGEHLRRIFGELLARLCNRLAHDRVDDIISRRMGLLKSFLDHLGREAVDLQVHLNGCDAFLCTRDLKVHVAEEILQALDVHHRHPAGALGDQAAGDARDRRLNRYARSHQRQRAAADGRL